MSRKKEHTNKSFYFEVFRFNPLVDEEPFFQGYDLVIEEDKSVLEALLKIQDEQDPTLGFRYACRGAISLTVR